MSVLPGHEVIMLGIVKGLVDPSIQTQPAGVDLTVREVFKFNGPGSLGLTNMSRVLPEAEKVEFNEGRVFLDKGAYRIKYNEVINVPDDCIGLGFPRSSLMRMGATIISAVWDPGYKGRGEGLLLVENPHGIMLQNNARVLQLILLKLTGSPHKKYDGSYQYEGLTSV